MDDADLVARARSGDESAWEALHRKYYQKLLRRARLYLRHAYDVEDVVQEAFKRAFQWISSLDDPDKFEGWIGTIVRNCAISWQRGKKGGGADPVPIGELEVPVPGTDASEGLLTEALVRDIGSILGREKAAVFLLSKAHRLSAAEIADECGKTPDSIHKIVQRAEEKLRRNKWFREKYGPDELES